MNQRTSSTLHTDCGTCRQPIHRRTGRAWTHKADGLPYSLRGGGHFAAPAEETDIRPVLTALCRTCRRWCFNRDGLWLHYHDVDEDRHLPVVRAGGPPRETDQ